MEMTQVLVIVVNIVLAICAFLCVFTIRSFKDSLDAVQKSVNQLNVNIATLIQQDKNKDQRLDEHKKDIERIDGEVLRLRERYHNGINDIGSRLTLLEITVGDIKDNKEKSK